MSAKKWVIVVLLVWAASLFLGSCSCRSRPPVPSSASEQTQMSKEPARTPEGVEAQKHLAGPGELSQEEAEYAKQREQMVREQIEARGVKDERLLSAMRKVPRHRFVPEKYRSAAYLHDGPLPIGHEQTISQPYIVALMTEQLRLKGTEKVLEIGTGSGYQAAILAELCKEVYTIEILEPLATQAEKLLKELGYKNITVKCGDGFFGWKEHAPFDAIIVTCAPPKVPQPLIDQLAVGGRLISPVGEQWEWQRLILITKTPQGVKEEDLGGVAFVPMTGEAQKLK